MAIDPATATAAQFPKQDAQTLIALLGDLMPLLLRLQSQGLEQPYQMAPGGSFQGPTSYNPAPGYSAMPGSTPAPGQNPFIDHQASVSLIEDITADSLRTLSTYLEAQAGRHPALESCIAIVTQAARCFAARDFAQAFALIWEAYRIITMVRAANPELPPPRGVAAPSASPASPTTSMH